MSKPVAVAQANCGCGFTFRGTITEAALACFEHAETKGHQCELRATVTPAVESKQSPMARFSLAKTTVRTVSGVAAFKNYAQPPAGQQGGGQ